MSKKSINVGIIGFGTVGSGTACILIENADITERRLGIPVKLKKIADLDIKRDRGVKLGDVGLTNDAREVLADPDIDIVVELMGGYSRRKSSSSRPSRTRSTWSRRTRRSWPCTARRSTRPRSRPM